MAYRKITVVSVAVLMVAGGLWVSASAGEKNVIPKQAREILLNAESWEVYSLNPSRLEVEAQQADEKSAETFHDWKVLGKTEIKDVKTRNRLFKAFEQGVKENTGIVAGCFNPRHGIRVTHQEQTADFVICFECMSVIVYLDGERAEAFLITGSPQKTFDQVLKKSGVQLASELADE